MPTKKQVRRERTLEQVVSDLGVYPMAAYEFVQQGLAYTVQKIHGQQREGKPTRHVSGQELCLGLREFAVAQWGFLARAVLGRWNVTATLDFGRIVFAMIDAGLMSRQDEDDLEDFRNVFEFRTAFESGYRIDCATMCG